jgi:hypothetical protein
VIGATIESAVAAVRAQLETLRARQKALEDKKIVVEGENKKTPSPPGPCSAACLPLDSEAGSS